MGWIVFHGAPLEACKGICATDFRTDKAGSGAANGRRPLYGWGVYFAERSTKADEYARDNGGGVFTMLVCKFVGGHALHWTGDGIGSRDFKEKFVDAGIHHSVFGDRNEKHLSPFNEIIAYDS